MQTMTRAQFEARKAQVAPVQSAPKTMTRAQFEARKAQANGVPNVANWEYIANVPKEAAKGIARAGLGVADIVDRLNPVEYGQNIDAGIKKVLTGDKNIPASVLFQQGRAERQARPLLWEQFTGNSVTKPQGGIDWQQGKNFIGDAASAPTYVYSGSKAFLENPTGNLLARVLKRYIGSIPVAGVSTGIQQFQQGNMDNVGRNLATNTAVMGTLSNVFGEGGRALRTFKKSPSFSEPIETPKVEAPQLKTSPIAETAKPAIQAENPLFQEARKYKSAEEFVKAQQPMYHGSPVPLKGFSNKKGGVYFTDNYPDATGFAGGPDNIYEGYTNFKKPLVIDAKGAKWDELKTKYGTSTQEVISNAQKDGYDGVVFKNIEDNVMDTANSGGTSTIHYAFKPRDSFINESQLTDIWNKVQEKRGITPITSPKVLGQKQRGYAKTISENPLTSPKVRQMLQDVNYIPQSNDALVKYATTIINTDLNKAIDMAIKSEDNLGLVLAGELIKKFQREGNDIAAVNLAKEVTPKLTEAGRYVQAASLYNKLTPEGIVLYATKEMSNEGLTLKPEQAKLLKELAISANNLTGEDKVIATTKMLNKVQEFIPSKFIDQLTTVWKAGLLTNPTTHIANFSGNATMTALETAKDYPAVLLDKFASFFTGKRTKALPSFGAMGEGVVSGGKKAWTFLKTGVDTDNTLGKIDYKQVNLPPGLKQYTQSIFRLLGASDKVFKEILFKKTLHELAVVDGLNQGLKGKKLAQFVVDRYASPTIQMVDQATKDSLKGTFNNSNVLANALNQLKSSKNPVVRGTTEFVAPFGRTPANIAQTILDYSPAGLGKASYQAIRGEGQRNVVESLARALVGSGIIGGGYALGKAGQMTGNYPTNPTEQAIWEATGKQPGALKVGGNWQSLNRISPVGNLLSIGSGMADLGRIKPENMPFAMAGVAGKNLLGQTYLQGVSGLLNAIQDPQRYSGNWTKNLAQSVVPTVIGAAMNPKGTPQVKTNSIREAIQNRLGLKSNLTPKTDVFGRQLQQESNPLFNPFNTKKDRADATTNEIGRLYSLYSGVSLDHPAGSASINGTGIKIDMTPQELSKFEIQTGGVFKQMLDKVIQTPVYQQMSDYDKAKTINNIISNVRQAWKIQNISKLSNFKEQLQKKLLEQIQLRKPNPFYTK